MASGIIRSKKDATQASPRWTRSAWAPSNGGQMMPYYVDQCRSLATRCVSQPPRVACRGTAARRGSKRSRSAASPAGRYPLRAHETPEHLVCRLLLEKKKKKYFF